MSNLKKGASPKIDAKKNIHLKLDDIINKTKLLNSTVLKRKSLKNSIQKLDAFSLVNDGLNVSLTIKEIGSYNDNNSFVTTNTIVIDGVAEFLKKIIFDKILLLEKELTKLNSL